MDFLNIITEPERRFFECLKTVDPESIWGLAIHNVVKAPDIMRFRRLVSELKSQAADDESVMRSILNEPCYNELINL